MSAIGWTRACFSPGSEMVVSDSSPTRRQISSASALAGITTRAPTVRWARTMPNPATWKKGYTPSSTSSGPCRTRGPGWRSPPASPRCESRQPFGVPVVPDVYRWMHGTVGRRTRRVPRAGLGTGDGALELRTDRPSRRAAPKPARLGQRSQVGMDQRRGSRRRRRSGSAARRRRAAGSAGTTTAPSREAARQSPRRPAGSPTAPPAGCPR